MKAWWRGTWLVTGRALAEHSRSRSFKFITGILLLLSVAAVVVPPLLSGGPATYTLAAVGRPDPGVREHLDAAARAGDFEVEYVSEADAARVIDAVRSGDASVGVANGKLYVAAEAGSSFTVLVAQALVAQETTRLLATAGLSPTQVAELNNIQPPDQVAVGRTGDSGRAGIGFAVGIVLYLALTFAGSMIATTVATEKASRISEVLLALLRPSQILSGNVLAIGIVTLFQLLILATPLVVSLSISDTFTLPSLAAGDIALGILWFVLGFLLYAFVFAATAALVDKLSEVGTAIMPVSLTLVLSYFVTILVVLPNPNSTGSTIASLFPLSAPTAMPVRWASGPVPLYQLAVSAALTAATAVLLVMLASRIYRRALVVTGRRVSMREVLKRRTSPVNERHLAEARH